VYCLDTWYTNFPLDGTKAHRVPHVVTTQMGDSNAKVASCMRFGASGSSERSRDRQFISSRQHGATDATDAVGSGQHRLADATDAVDSRQHGAANAADALEALKVNR
jgi:hypothetical protein